MKIKLFAMNLFTSLTYLSSTRIFAGATSAPATDCKCQPSEKCWPDRHAWSRLNITTDGALIKAVPPGIVCYPGPSYDAEACEKVTDLSKQHPWIVEQPAYVMHPGYNNANPCPPTNGSDENAGGTCGPLLGSPVYVINATKVSQVEAGIKFAKKYNIRLVVKNTGHEFIGKSSGAHSLSIWTHHMKSATFSDNFKPEKCKNVNGQEAVTVGAGMQWAELAALVDAKGKLIVTGGNPTVGCIGGFLQGGGHSPIGAKYGMAVDQVLEFKLVTPDGKYITANECQNTDYFWALRGGGGGTFGVVTSATLKTYPGEQFAIAIQRFNTTGDLDTYWDWIGHVSADVPRIVESGLMGYYYVHPNANGEPTYDGIWILPGGNVEQLSEILAPLESNLTTGKYKDHVVGSIESFLAPTFGIFFQALFPPDVAGGTAVLPSRLLDRRALTENRDFYVSTLKNKLWGNFVGAQINHIIGGPGVWKNKDVDMALNPAWRRTYNHLIAATGIDNLGVAKPYILDFAKNVLDYHLKQLAPHTGQYLNEALYDAEGWQQANWGINYPRLYSFKSEIDPDGVFYCHNCVGSEKWVEGENGSLCRAAWAKI